MQTMMVVIKWEEVINNTQRNAAAYTICVVRVYSWQYNVPCDVSFEFMTYAAAKSEIRTIRKKNCS